MSRDLEVAKASMLDGGYTCVAVKNEQIYISKERGVKPLMAWLDEGINLHGFAVADKVIGNGAAMLYVLLGVKEIYTPIVSESAKATLDACGVMVCFDECVEGIVNRAGTGPCPMEEAVAGISDPRVALEAMRKRLAELAK